MKLYIEKWMKGKDPLVAGNALKIAYMSEEVYQLSFDAREKTLVSSYFEMPDLKTWLALYSKPQHIDRAILKPSRDAGGNYELDILLYDSVSVFVKGVRRDKEGVIVAYKNMTPDERNTIHRYRRIFVKKWKRQLINEIKDDINNVSDPAFEEASKGMDKSPELTFYLKVTLPCWFNYIQHPSQLLYKAQKGDCDALDQLIRIDPSVIFDPEISEHFHRAVHSPKRSLASKYIDPLKNPPKTFTSRRKAKIRLAGMILIISEGLGGKLKVSEIRKLFDSIAADLGRGVQDSDLPDDDRDFRSAIELAAQLFKITLLEELEKGNT